MTNLRIASFILMITLLLQYDINAQTQKRTYYVLLHNFSPTGIKIDGLPVSLFPQNSGLGFSYGSHRTKLNGEMLDVKEKVFTYGMTLSGHYFVFDNFSFGVSVNYYAGTTTYKETGKPDEKYSTSMLLGGPELRYYLPIGNHLKSWIKASPSVGNIESTYDGREVHIPKRLYQFCGGVGLSYFPVASASLDVGVSYNVFTVRNRGGYTENSRKEYIDGVGLDMGFSVFF